MIMDILQARLPLWVYLICWLFLTIEIAIFAVIAGKAERKYRQAVNDLQVMKSEQGDQPSKNHASRPIMGVLTEGGKLCSLSEYYGVHADAIRASLLVDWVADRKELDEL